MGVLRILHGLLAQPVVALGFSGLSLLLLVLVLLSVPGPIKGLSWFRVASPVTDGAELITGLQGWCWSGTSNCTYAAIRDVDKAANLKSGRAMETIAVSALFSMGSFFVACYGLYLRIEDTSSEWKEEIACLIFNASAAGGTNTGIIRTAPSAQGNAKGRGKGIFGQFGASRTSVDEDWDWDRGSLNRGVTIFSRPSSRNNGKREAEKFEIPTEDRMESIPVDGDDGCHAVTITQDADLETGVTYTVLNRNRS
ncbi:hypothetical protein QFC21_002798 [Naganishia friedmannii]|uniref:Uncharacterized protein n=1 Tax=Naganishia friedmannii TaxID=89922 RepID=A0ACC2VSN8_9TREE|nr:hypothetical protein QFC21_002798 [Naganishia friedmannii]